MMTQEQIREAVGTRRMHVERVSEREWAVDGVSCWTMDDVQRVIRDYDARTEG